MEDNYDFKKVEPSIARLWEEGNYFKPREDASRRPYSMFFMPPNASGPLHVGNALMLAIQDVLARYHRASGEPTLWIPGTDHGGYETQVTFERELEQQGKSRDDYSRRELFDAIAEFVARNNDTITKQVKAFGASVDWSRFRYTLDADALQFVHEMFRKMVRDDLIYRNSYMVHYCTECATVLADIELKEVQTEVPLYVVQFPLQDGSGTVPLATTHPEFLFAVTHVLVHPQDTRFAHLIDTILLNPVTGREVQVVESKRRFDPQKADPYFFVFSPSHKKYDFEYAIRNNIPTLDLFSWDGMLNEPYAGMSPQQVREEVLEVLSQQDAIEVIDAAYPDAKLLCKKGHSVISVIRMTWFLRLDGGDVSLKKLALDALQKENPPIVPSWRKKGLLEWIGKMHDWPIARQNVWGIKIPVWYELRDPSLFTVWFIDSSGVRRNGNLQYFLDENVPLQQILDGLERVYAAPGAVWTLEQDDGKEYLPDTDTFDTWFSSCVWGLLIYGDIDTVNRSPFYPSNIIVLGHDLLRLFIARKVLLGQYLTGRIPFRRVFFHQLLKSEDGQKMSKSLGNAHTLDEYVEEYGADTTRAALVSYSGLQEDFVFSNERLEFFKEFSQRLWKMGRVAEAANTYAVKQYETSRLSAEDTQLISGATELSSAVGSSIEKYFLASAQERAVSFLEQLESYASAILARDDTENALAVFYRVYKDYLLMLHPFMPFITEELYSSIYTPERPLAATVRQTRNK